MIIQAVSLILFYFKRNHLSKFQFHSAKKFLRSFRRRTISLQRTPSQVFPRKFWETSDYLFFRTSVNSSFCQPQAHCSKFSVKKSEWHRLSYTCVLSKFYFASPILALNVPLLYPLKISKNYFSDVFRGYRNCILG